VLPDGATAPFNLSGVLLAEPAIFIMRDLPVKLYLADTLPPSAELRSFTLPRLEYWTMLWIETSP